MFDPDRIRCEAERRGHRALAWLRNSHTPQATKDPDAILRDLRADGLFVTRAMAPEAFAVLDRVRDRFEIDREVLIHQQDGIDNASSITAGDQPIVQFRGSWLRGLPEDELAAVIGHELGHWLDFTDPEIRLTSALCKRNSSVAARMFYLGVEVTADRFGLFASGSFEAAARIELRYAAGPNARLVEDVPSYVAQARAFGEALLARGESTRGDRHPEHLVRMFVLSEFASSDLAAELMGRSTEGRPFADVEERITRLLTVTTARDPLADTPTETPGKIASPGPVVPDDADLRETVAEHHAESLLTSAGAALKAVDATLLTAFGAAGPVLERAFDSVRAVAENVLHKPGVAHPDAVLEARFQELERRAGKR